MEAGAHAKEAGEQPHKVIDHAEKELTAASAA